MPDPKQSPGEQAQRKSKPGQPAQSEKGGRSEQKSPPTESNEINAEELIEATHRGEGSTGEDF